MRNVLLILSLIACGIGPKLLNSIAPRWLHLIRKLTAPARRFCFSTADGLSHALLLQGFLLHRLTFHPPFTTGAPRDAYETVELEFVCAHGLHLSMPTPLEPEAGLFALGVKKPLYVGKNKFAAALASWRDQANSLIVVVLPLLL